MAYLARAYPCGCRVYNGPRSHVDHCADAERLWRIVDALWDAEPRRLKHAVDMFQAHYFSQTPTCYPLPDEPTEARQLALF